MTETYKLQGKEYIELIKLIKILRICETGGQARLLVEDGVVLRNGEIEFRKRAKLRAGDRIRIMDFTVEIIL
jgi:ribosome-associated protein